MKNTKLAILAGMLALLTTTLSVVTSTPADARGHGGRGGFGRGGGFGHGGGFRRGGGFRFRHGGRYWWGYRNPFPGCYSVWDPYRGIYVYYCN
jgi:hypothetical protein